MHELFTALVYFGIFLCPAIVAYWPRQESEDELEPPVRRVRPATKTPSANA